MSQATLELSPQSESAEPVEESIHCPTCNARHWKYFATYSTIVPSGHRELQNEEVRCARCNRKATATVESQLRETSYFRAILKQEEMYR